MLKVRVGVLVSGGGTNLQALIDAEKEQIIPSCELALVISSSPDAYALKRAEKAGIKSAVVDKKSFESRLDFEKEIISILQLNKIDLIVLAGFMFVLSGDFTSYFKDRIINVHPSLIPSFCGDGFYGLKVHEAALDYGVKVSGATVHYVNEITDGGKIILQKSVYIDDDETPKSLQKKIMENAEWMILPKACEIVAKKIIDENRGVDNGN